MRFLQPYINPTDPRWQGSKRWGPLLMLPITFLFILVWILFIADQAYSRVLFNRWAPARAEMERTRNWDMDIPPYPPVQWDDGYAVGEFFFRAGIVIIPETIHIPIHHWLLYRNKLHPVAALCCSLFAWLLWMINSLMHFFILYYSELNTSDYPAWDQLCYAGYVVQFIIVLLYIVYFGFAVKAVHDWRANRMNHKSYQAGLKAGIELGAVERIRLEGKVHDEEANRT